MLILHSAKAGMTKINAYSYIIPNFLFLTVFVNGCPILRMSGYVLKDWKHFDFESRFALSYMSTLTFTLNLSIFAKHKHCFWY